MLSVYYRVHFYIFFCYIYECASKKITDACIALYLFVVTFVNLVLSILELCKIETWVSESGKTIINSFEWLTPCGKWRCIFMEMKYCASVTVWYNKVVRGSSAVDSICSVNEVSCTCVIFFFLWN